MERNWEYNGTVHQLFIDFGKVYYSIRKEILYIILTEVDIPMKLVRIIKMCLKETYSEVRIGKNLSVAFPIQNNHKRADDLSSLLLNYI
jgi:hypothetical protein